MIALPKDTREALGDFAQKIENRSLLFQKAVLAKSWGHPDRFDDANRFNVLRACSAGRDLLLDDADAAQRSARKAEEKRESDKVRQYKYKEGVARAMASVKTDFPQLAKAQIENAKDLLRRLEASHPHSCRTLSAALGGRLLINLAGGVQENAGLCLDRCFGLPYIPGSATKGVTRNAALWDIKNETDAHAKARKLRNALLAFGFAEVDCQRQPKRDGDGVFYWAAGELAEKEARSITKDGHFKGLVSFLPAYPTSEPLIVAEVLTRHPRSAEAAKGVGKLTPLFFPAVEKGSSFGFAIVATRWPAEIEPVAPILQACEEWLIQAICISGIGAKTGAGYGWFEFDPQAEASRRAEAAERLRKAEEKRRIEAQEAERQNALSPREKAAEGIRSLSPEGLAEFAKAIAAKSETEQRVFFELLLGKDFKDTRKRWKDRKPEIWQALQSAATNLQISLS
jgi:CRISPR-associated protein Cmr6